MSLTFRRTLTGSFVLCTLLFLTAAKKASNTKLEFDRGAPVVDLFDGIEQGVFEVRVSPKDEYSAKVYITNTSAAPKTVKLPKAAVGVHVLKQQFPFAQIGNGSSLDSGGAQNGPGQTVGGNFSQQSGSQQNGSGSPFNFFPGGNGMFSIPPEKTVQIQFNSVCLDHGKPAPRLRMKYVLRPVEDEVESPALRHLLENYDPRSTNRRVMQAAAWHLASDMSWQQLAAKRVRHIGRTPQRYLSQRQFEAAKALVTHAGKNAQAGREKSRVAQKVR